MPVTMNSASEEAHGASLLADRALIFFYQSFQRSPRFVLFGFRTSTAVRGLVLSRTKIHTYIQELPKFSAQACTRNHTRGHFLDLVAQHYFFEHSCTVSLPTCNTADADVFADGAILVGSEDDFTNWNWCPD